jgi:hypothetical protein
VTVEEGQLLRTVGRVVGRVEVDRDPLDHAPQTPAVPLDHRLGERHAHPVQIRPIERVLEARQRRLRGKVFATHRIPTAEQLVDRVTPEQALSRIAPPSELPCSLSNVATTGRRHRPENRTRCRVLSSSTQRPLE